MITIDFEQSHLFFPRIMLIITFILFMAIVIKFLPGKIKAYQAGDRPKFFIEGYDKVRFYGALGLIIAYFKGMGILGDLFPNTGYGFLIASIVLIFTLSVLFTGKPDRKKMVVISLNSILTPATAWFVFGILCNISLP